MLKPLSVIGLGKLGLCTAACFAKAGYPVTGVDIRPDYVTDLQQGKVPFYENGLEEVLREARNTLTFTTSISDAIVNTDVSFIIVPTPSGDDGAFDNSYIIKVIHELAPFLAKKTSFHIINIVSTVMPGSSQDIFIPLLEQLTQKKVGQDFGVAYNPEFIAIGSVINDFLNPDLVLIGESDEQTGKTLEEIYLTTCTNSPHIARTNLINAEISKLALNCYCTMKISFANNIASLCDNIPQSDATQICNIIGRDSRVGEKYIKPGLGFGGPCFPRDNEAFIRLLEKQCAFIGLQKAVIEINNKQPKRIARKIATTAEKFGHRVALLGLSYKPDTPLTERSQAIDIAYHLANHYPHLKLQVHDPLAKDTGPWIQTETLEECMNNIDLAAILTPYPQFFELAARLGKTNPTFPIINCWE